MCVDIQWNSISHLHMHVRKCVFENWLEWGKFAVANQSVCVSESQQ